MACCSRTQHTDNRSEAAKPAEQLLRFSLKLEPRLVLTVGSHYGSNSNSWLHVSDVQNFSQTSIILQLSVSPTILCDSFNYAEHSTIENPVLI